MKENEYADVGSEEKEAAKSIHDVVPDERPDNNRSVKRGKRPGKGEEPAEQKLIALQLECKRAEAERNQLEKRKKMVHASYCILLALGMLAALIIIPKLQRVSYLKGYQEGLLQSTQSEQEQTNPSEQPEQREQPVPSTEIRVPDSASASEVALYIGNKNSKKFHLPSCTGLPKEKNQVFFESREEALEEGYTPCSICSP